MSVFAGIDPGLSGGLFLLDTRHPSSGGSLDLPVHWLARAGKKKREVDIQGLLGLLSPGLEHAFVEQVGAMPGQGVTSAFVFGKCFGIILAALAAREIPVTPVAPAQWKRALGVPKAKDGAHARASQLLPTAAQILEEAMTEAFEMTFRGAPIRGVVAVATGKSRRALK